MFHCSAAEGQRFQEEMIRVSEIIERLGSNPIKESLINEKSKDSKNEKKIKTE
jgi:hypothetical protein